MKSILLALLAFSFGCGAAAPSPQTNRETETLRTPPSGSTADRFEAIRVTARQQQSDALLILQNNRLEVNDVLDPDRRICLMSMTKSVVGMAVAIAKQEGLFRSLDQPVSDFIPEWQSDAQKAQITLRHLMNHTSGLSTDRVPREGNDYDLVSWTIASPMISDPGTQFRYNNNAVDLLGEVIARAAHTSLQDYLHMRLFAALDILPPDVEWTTDMHGHPFAAGELAMRPMDVLKLGILILNNGYWNGRPILPAGYFDQVSTQSQAFEPSNGLLWWKVMTADSAVFYSHENIERIRSAGLPQNIIDQLEALEGRRFPPGPAFFDHLRPILLTEEYRDQVRQIEAANAGIFEPESDLRFEEDLIRADGWLGQHLVIDRLNHLVAVRMRAANEADYRNPNGPQVNHYPEFPSEIAALRRSE